MEIKSNSWIAIYYRWMFNDKLPNDFCTLFWNTLLSLCSLPLTIPAYLTSFAFGNEVWNDRNLLGKMFHGFLTYFGFIVAYFIGLATWDNVFGSTWKTWDFWSILGVALVGFIGVALVVILVILSVVGICAGVYYSTRYLFNKKIVYKTKYDNGNEYDNFYYEPKKFKIAILWNTIRNKYCTKITWK